MGEMLEILIPTKRPESEPVSNGISNSRGIVYQSERI